MNHINIGSNGFAQVGQEDYYGKCQVEMRVLLNYLNTNFPVPEQFVSLASYAKKSYMHEFGAYTEIVLLYNDRVILWDTDKEFANKFWEWVCKIESIDLECDELTCLIADAYIVYLKKKRETLRQKNLSATTF